MLIVERLLSCFPDHDIIAEEGDYLQSGSLCRWIIDPVDGTTNYAHGYPWFCSSIALEVEKELVAGVIYNPIYDELFTAIKGEGSYLNGNRLYDVFNDKIVASNSLIHDSMVTTLAAVVAGVTSC